MPAGQPKALVPQDLRGVRNQQIGYLQNPEALLRMLGGLGSPQSALQMQAGDSFSKMLTQPTPEQRALDISLPALQSMLTGAGPQFDQDLSLANQQGGRFGSANALLRGEAFRNLYNMRNQVANTIGLLGQGAGQANRGLATQAFGVGQQQAQQGDLETQRRLQVLMQLLGVGQQAAFNVPIQKSPSFFEQVAPLIGTIFGGGFNPFGGGQQQTQGGGGVNPGTFTPAAFGSSGLGNIDPFTGKPR